MGTPEKDATGQERVAAFRGVVRSHVPGRYAGTVALLVPEDGHLSFPDSQLLNFYFFYFYFCFCYFFFS